MARRGLNYTRPDQPDHEDSPLDWLHSALIFARALGHILEDREGVVVDVVGDIEWDKAKKVMVFRDGDQVRIFGCDEGTEMPDGQMLWVD